MKNGDFLRTVPDCVIIDFHIVHFSKSLFLQEIMNLDILHSFKTQSGGHLTVKSTRIGVLNPHTESGGHLSFKSIRIGVPKINRMCRGTSTLNLSPTK